MDSYMRWLNFNFPAPSVQEGEEIAQALKPSQHPQYWSYLNKCVVRGLVQAARKLLEYQLNDRVSGSSEELINSAMNLLDNMPRSSGYRSYGEFTKKWRIWREECRHLAMHERNVNFCTLFSILSGDEETILDVTESWEDALGAMLLY
ncbi:hypothetical protein K7432_010446 [Basidiobolus ranarum]|uniref:Nuclear pore complex protein Nup85 n=1 Tax=Basidiobolus ranarum TaxID=34480 RepID=A0ABR2VVM0_9FUNG